MNASSPATVRAIRSASPRSAPFRWLGVAAIVAAGLIAATIARHATEHLVWMVAYLVLVVGVVQYALGLGPARVSTHAPALAVTWMQWALLNLGHAGVIVGTLIDSFVLVVAGTTAYIVAVAWLGLSVRGSWRDPARTGYRVLVLVMLVSSLTGLGLSAVGA